MDDYERRSQDFDAEWLTRLIFNPEFQYHFYGDLGQTMSEHAEFSVLFLQLFAEAGQRGDGSGALLLASGQPHDLDTITVLTGQEPDYVKEAVEFLLKVQLLKRLDNRLVVQHRAFPKKPEKQTTYAFWSRLLDGRDAD